MNVALNKVALLGYVSEVQILRLRLELIRSSRRSSSAGGHNLGDFINVEYCRLVVTNCGASDSVRN